MDDRRFNARPICFFTKERGWDVGTARGVGVTSAGVKCVLVHTREGQRIEVTNGADVYAPVSIPAQRLISSILGGDAPSTTTAPEDAMMTGSSQQSAIPPADLTVVTELHSSLIVAHLRQRHALDRCYTFLGPLLMALNPFRYTIPRYQPSRMRHYLARFGVVDPHDIHTAVDASLGGGQGGGGATSVVASGGAASTTAGSPAQALLAQQRRELLALCEAEGEVDADSGNDPSHSDGDDHPKHGASHHRDVEAPCAPHPWAIAHRVYHEMRLQSKNHSIIISGESGSGKTEGCKLVLSYLSALSILATSSENGATPATLAAALAANGGGAGGGGSDGGLMSPLLFSPKSFASRSVNFSSAADVNDASEPRSGGGEGRVLQSPPSLQPLALQTPLEEPMSIRLSRLLNGSNPIMEAFGNAKTSRNDNSSRFGKLLEVQFDTRGSVMGMHMTPFLLEKSRCVFAAPDERVFHAMYQLVCGAPDALRHEFELHNPNDFVLLTQGGCVQVPGIDDAKDFRITQSSFDSLGFTREEQHAIWAVVAAVLHLGNVVFEVPTPPAHTTASAARAMFEQRTAGAAPGGAATSTSANESVPAVLSSASIEKVELACRLLGISNVADFTRYMTVSVSRVRNEEVVKVLPRHKALEQRDTICKHLYSCLFHWIVARINAAVKDLARSSGTRVGAAQPLPNGMASSPVAGGGSSSVRPPPAPAPTVSSNAPSPTVSVVPAVGSGAASPSTMRAMYSNSILLLDIFGFEDFTTGNSLEQLCINLANEALQRHYSRHIFERDAEEIAQEGVTAQTAAFFDNEPCVQLIMAQKGSIFTMLDDAAALDLDRATTDPNVTLLARLTEKFKPDFQTMGGGGRGAGRAGANGAGSAGNATAAKASGTLQESRGVLERDRDAMKAPADFFTRGRLDADSFTVRHFAGDVKYRVAGFVQKNVDAVKDTVKALLATSNDACVVDMLCGDSASEAAGMSAASPFTSPSRGTGSTAGSPTNGAGSNGPGWRVSIASQFRRSLESLLAKLDQTTPHWIRCIRPHPAKAPRLFDTRSVLEQLTATGVLETIAQRQRNFPFRIDSTTFVHRFAVICGAGTARRLARSGMRERCAAIVAAFNSFVTKQQKATTALSGSAPEGSMPPSPGAGSGSSNIVLTGPSAAVQVGRTRVFLRSEAMELLERCRDEALRTHAAVTTRFILYHRAAHTRAVVRASLAARRIQKWFRRLRRFRKVVAEFYAELRRKRDARHAEERAAVLTAERAQRGVVLEAERAIRDTFLPMHRRDVAPLLAAAILHMQVAEGHIRAATFTTPEAAERAALYGAARESFVAAQSATRARIEAERRALALAIDRCIDDVQLTRRRVRTEEAEERSALEAEWRPVAEWIAECARRIRQFNSERDARVAHLEQLASEERERLQRHAAAKVAAEATLWKNAAGPHVVESSLRTLTHDLGLSLEDAENHLRTFFHVGGPTALLRASAARSALPGANVMNSNPTLNTSLHRRPLHVSTTSSGNVVEPAVLRPDVSSPIAAASGNPGAPGGLMPPTTGALGIMLRERYTTALRRGEVSRLPNVAAYFDPTAVGTDVVDVNSIGNGRGAVRPDLQSTSTFAAYSATSETHRIVDGQNLDGRSGALAYAARLTSSNGAGGATAASLREPRAAVTALSDVKMAMPHAQVGFHATIDAGSTSDREARTAAYVAFLTGKQAASADVPVAARGGVGRGGASISLASMNSKQVPAGRDDVDSLASSFAPSTIHETSASSSAGFTWRRI